MALDLEGFDSTDDALDTVARYARVAVDADDAGIMVLHGQNVTTPAGTSSEVTEPTSFSPN